MTDSSAPDSHLPDLHQLQAIVDASSDCVKVLDLDARLLSMNAGGLVAMEIEHFGSCHLLLWPEFWTGDGRLQVEAGLQAAREGRTFTFEGQANTFAGTPRWWDVRISPLRDRAGEITNLLAVSRDITARKRAEQEMQAQREQVQAYRVAALERQVSSQEQALEAFVQFTTTVASNTDLQVLAAAAADTFRRVLHDVSSGFYLIQGETAFPLAFSGNTPPELQAARRATGLSVHAPMVVKALQSPGAAFIEQEDAPEQTHGHACRLAITAYRRQGQPYALVTTATTRPAWTTQEKAIIDSVGRALGLALDRAHQVEILNAQNRILQQQTQALETERASLDAFVNFTQAAGAGVNALELARQAERVLRAALDRIVVVTYVQEGEFWKAVRWSDDLPQEVRAAVRQGVPVGAPNFAAAARSGQSVFVDGQPAGNGPASSAAEYGTIAFVPLQGGEVPWLLTVGMSSARAWTPRERSIIQAVGSALTLALKRTEQARQLLLQRDALSVRSQELQASNAELEALTFSASHDLRTPVRHVRSFTDLAQIALQRGEYAQVEQRLEIVRHATTRLEALIDGMLTLSRTGRQELQLQWIALDRIVAQARQDVEQEYPGRPVLWEVGELPQVHGDPRLIRQAITNLLNNALKFSAKEQRAEVKVWVEEVGGAWRISVQDNGVGFDPRFQQKLFGLFQRLHHERDFQGTGVGLATTRRIVLKHGGQVFAQSPDLKGARFGFTLPKPAQEPQEVKEGLEVAPVADSL